MSLQFSTPDTIITELQAQWAEEEVGEEAPSMEDVYLVERMKETPMIVVPGT